MTYVGPSLIGHLASVDVKQHESKEREGGRNGDVVAADVAGVVRGDGVAPDGRQMCATASPGSGLCHEWAD